MEQVVLLSEGGAPTGTALKSEVHTTDTPLHLAFSCHVFDSEGRVLITRRSLDKKTWPGVWTNSFCGHPGPDEDMEAAVRRRSVQEIGAQIRDIRLVLPDFRYRAVDASGIVENEICPVHIATLDGPLDPDPSEISEWAWAEPDDLVQAVSSAPYAFSPWIVEQLPLLRTLKAL